jgi:hypothetical protein
MGKETEEPQGEEEREDDVGEIRYSSHWVVTQPQIHP